MAKPTLQLPGYITHVMKTNQWCRVHHADKPYGVWSYRAKGFLSFHADRSEAEREARRAEREGR